MVIERRALRDEPVREARVIDRIDALLAEARSLPNCFLWMLWRERPQPADEALGTIAACYEALGAAALLVEHADAPDVGARPGEVLAAMQLMAEADSALRIALMPSWLTSPDTDQEAAHLWLRDEVPRRGLWVSRYMKLDDPADPARIHDLLGEVQRLRASFDQRAGALATIRDAFRQIRYHARRLARDPVHADPHDARRIAQAAGTLIEGGVPPVDSRFADAVSPSVAALVLPHASEETRTVFVRLCDSSAEPPPDDPAAVPVREWSAQVLEVRQLLRHRQVVIVGGQARPEAARRIEEAFDLLHVEWVRLTEHGTTEPMRAPVAHDDTVLVLVLVKLTGHLHAEETVAQAKACGKPWVLLPAGYNPEQIAAAVLQQAAGQLRALSPVTSGLE